MNKKFQLLFFLLTSIVTDGFGRGRIPWRKGDGYRVLILLAAVAVIILVTTFAYKWLIAYKAKKINKLITQSAQSDPAWNKEKLMAFIKDAYLRIQNAWMKQNMELVQDIVNPTLRGKYQRLLEYQKTSGVYNFIDKINIDKIKIIGLEDYVENEKDNFTTYISGQMVNLIVRKNGKVLKEVRLENFEDLYYFIRTKNGWVIKDISNEVDIWNVIDTKPQKRPG